MAEPESADSSWPSKVIVPPLGSVSRTRQRPRLVLPQPDSPTSPTVSPSSTSRLTPSIALTYSRPRRSSPLWTGKYFFKLRISSSAILRSHETSDAVLRFDLDQRRLGFRAARLGARAAVAK